MENSEIKKKEEIKKHQRQFKSRGVCFLFSMLAVILYINKFIIKDNEQNVFQLFSS